MNPSSFPFDYSPKLLESILNVGADYICVKNVAGLYVYVNELHATLYNAKPQDMIGKTAAQWMGQDQFDRWQVEDVAIIKEGRTRHFQPHSRTTGDGRVRWFDSVKIPFTDEQSGQQLLLVIHRDITHLKEAEQERNALRDHAAQTDKRLQSILRNSLDSITCYEAVRNESGKIYDFRLTLVNPAAEKRLGEPAASLVGKSLVKTFPHLIANGLYYKFVSVVDTGQAIEMDYASPRTEPPRWYRLAAVKQDDGLVVFFTDINDRKAAEQAVLEAKDRAESADRAKGAFLATITHELRTPMNGILGFTNLLLDTKIDADQRDYLDTIRRSGKSLLTLIDELLDLSKIEAGKLELEIHEFVLRDCLRDALALFTPEAKKKNLQLQVTIPDDVPSTIVADPTRLRQVVVNLLSNALKFTTKGRIDFNLRLDSGAAQGDAIVFEVRDTGIGMAPEVLKRLFQPFEQGDSSVTRRYGGTGLGLVICKRLIELMKGEIEVNSVPGQGSIFRFYLPYQVPERVPSTKTRRLIATTSRLKLSQTTTLSGAGRDLRILVAEDNSVNMRVAQLILERLGYRADAVTNGLECLEAVQQESYDVIFMDMQMLEMDGVECTRRIRSMDLPIYIVAMTADARSMARDQCLAAGMNDYITKPLSQAEMRRVLKQALTR